MAIDSNKNFNLFCVSQILNSKNLVKSNLKSSKFKFKKSNCMIQSIMNNDCKSTNKRKQHFLSPKYKNLNLKQKKFNYLNSKSNLTFHDDNSNNSSKTTCLTDTTDKLISSLTNQNDFIKTNDSNVLIKITEDFKCSPLNFDLKNSNLFAQMMILSNTKLIYDQWFKSSTNMNSFNYKVWLLFIAQLEWLAYKNQLDQIKPNQENSDSNLKFDKCKLKLY